MHERKELPGVQRFSLCFELGLQHVGKRQIHVVAAKKNVLSDADAFEFQGAAVIGHSNQAEIGGPAAHITDQDDVTGS